jgi:hypothetical protein
MGGSLRREPDAGGGVKIKLEDGTEVPFADIAVLTLKPGDYLILRAEQKLSMEAVERLHNAFRRSLPELVGRVLVLDGGLEMAILRPEAPDAA